MNNKKSPAIKIEVQKDKTYYWCSCGLTKKMPFCDGSHKEEEKCLKPIKFTSPTNKTVSFCTCQKTKTPPICDGSHKCLNNPIY